MVQEAEFYNSINHWKLNSLPKSECILKQNNNNNKNENSNAMHTQIGHNLPELTYSADIHPYSISVPCIINQKSFPYVNNASLGSHSSLNHITSAVSQPSPYPVVPMLSSYPIDSNQYLSAGVANNHNKLLNPSVSTNVDSNVSNDSEFDGHCSSLKKRRKPAPTIATGRRNLKNETVAPEEAERRIKRRERNRKSAQRCRERKIEKKETLQKELDEIKEKINKYLELAENIVMAWKGRLRFIDENMPGNNFKSQLSVFEFEQLIESYMSRHNAASEPERGDNCSPQSSVMEPSVTGSIKQEYLIGQPPIQTSINNNIMTCVKVDQYYQTSFTNDLLPPNIVNSPYDRYQHPFANDNDIEYI